MYFAHIIYFSHVFVVVVHKICKSDCWVKNNFFFVYSHYQASFVVSSHLSVLFHVTARVPLDGFPWDFVLGTFMKSCREPISLMSDENIGHFVWRLSTLYSIFLYCWQWRVTKQYTQNELLRFHCNSGCVNAPQCYIIRTLSVVLWMLSNNDVKTTTINMWDLQNVRN